MQCTHDRGDGAYDGHDRIERGGDDREAGERSAGAFGWATAPGPGPAEGLEGDPTLGSYGAAYDDGDYDAAGDGRDAR